MSEVSYNSIFQRLTPHSILVEARVSPRALEPFLDVEYRSQCEATGEWIH